MTYNRYKFLRGILLIENNPDMNQCYNLFDFSQTYRLKISVILPSNPLATIENYHPTTPLI